MNSLFHLTLRCLLVLLAICLPGAVTSYGATISLHMDISQDNNPNGVTYYYAYPYFDIDPPSATTNAIISPGGHSYYITGAGGSFLDVSGGGITSMEDMLLQLTNGLWTLIINSNSPAQAEYKFALSITNLNSDTWPVVVIHEPEFGATGVAGRPPIHWSGPTNWSGIQAFLRNLDASFHYSSLLDFDSTNWASAPSLPSGDTSVEINYELLNAPMFHFATPTNSSGTVTGWTSTVKLQSYRVHDFNIATVPAFGHALQAHYPFDQTNHDGTVSGVDESGNGNDINSSLGWGNPPHEFSTNAAAGPGAIRFHGFTALLPPTNLLAAFGGSFSVSTWVRTTQVAGGDGDPGVVGAGIVYAETFEGLNDSVPIALTGSKAAFWTANAGAGDHTIHSSSNINSGEYVHIVVTRSQETGEKRIYINGELDSSGTGTTAYLVDAFEEFSLLIGASKNQVGFNGLIDDVQIYTGVLSESEVAFLHANPGDTVADVSSITLAQALDLSNVEWTTGGDAEWFGQTSVSSDDTDAAASPALGDGQSSWVETVIPYDGDLSFQWKVSCEEDASYLSFFINGAEQVFITGEVDWASGGQHEVQAGDTVRWEYRKEMPNGVGEDRGWLDQVEYTPDLSLLSMTMQLRIHRIQSVDGNIGFFALPGLIGYFPQSLTDHRIESPNNRFSAGTGGAGVEVLGTLEEVIDECTTGSWKLWFNRSHASELPYTFNVFVTDLDTNVLAPARILSPTNGITVSTNPAFTWTGPAFFTDVEAKVYQPGVGGQLNFIQPATATNWPSAPSLPPGTNRFEIEYQSNNVPMVTFSTPENGNGEPLASWSAQGDLRSSAAVEFLVNAAPLLSRAHITNVIYTPGNIGFAVMTLAGHTHAIEARTNLLSGPWLELSNFSGDGNLKQFTFPTTNPPTRFFRVRTQ